MFLHKKTLILDYKKSMLENKSFHKSDLSKFSFLITGGAGFKGSNIVGHLIANNAGLDRV